jgi:hypothetical protein
VVLGTLRNCRPGNSLGQRLLRHPRRLQAPGGPHPGPELRLGRTEPPLRATPTARPGRGRHPEAGRLQRQGPLRHQPARPAYFRTTLTPPSPTGSTTSSWTGSLAPLSLKANYRAVDPQYAERRGRHVRRSPGLLRRRDGPAEPRPLRADEEGLGVELGLPLGPVELGGYLNSYGTYPYNLCRPSPRKLAPPPSWPSSLRLQPDGRLRAPPGLGPRTTLTFTRPDERPHHRHPQPRRGRQGRPGQGPQPHPGGTTITCTPLASSASLSTATTSWPWAP